MAQNPNVEVGIAGVPFFLLEHSTGVVNIPLNSKMIVIRLADSGPMAEHSVKQVQRFLSENKIDIPVLFVVGDVSVSEMDETAMNECGWYRTPGHHEDTSDEIKAGSQQQ